jgi:hypothetical protein
MSTHEYTIMWGSTARRVFVHAFTGTAPAVGLRASTPGATAAFIREGEGAVTVELVEGTGSHHTPGGWAEVDPLLMPGVYEFGLPDAVLAKGSGRAMVSIRFPGVSVDPVEIELVAYDPLDAVYMGMTSLRPAERLAALRGAFPILAGKEIEARRAQLGEQG